MKALLIEHLDKPALLYALWMRRKYSIYFLTVESNLERNPACAIIQAAGLEALSFEDLKSEEKENYILSHCAAWASQYADRHVESSWVDAIARYLGFNELLRRRFLCALESHLCTGLERYAQLDLFAREMADRFSSIEVLGSAEGRLLRFAASECTDQYSEHKPGIAGCILWFRTPFLRNPLFALKAAARRFLARLPLLSRLRHALRGRREIISQADQEWLRSARVVYLPHQGIWYGDMFRKEQFYSSEPESALYPARIPHLSIYEKNLSAAAVQRSQDFYRENGIRSFHIEDFPAPAEKTVLLAQLVSRKSRPASKESRHAFELCDQSFRTVQGLRAVLGLLESVKLVLVGYEILFPPLLSIAFRLRGARTIAVQERFITVFYKFYKIPVDIYLTAGPMATEMLENSPRDYPIEQCIDVGLYRTDYIRSLQQEGDGKYGEIRRKMRLVLCLDFHSAPTQSENRLSLVNNWRFNKRFYIDLIRLSVEFPGIYFVIKGKNTDVLRNPSFADIVRIIAGLPNIAFEEDRETYTSYRLASMADGAVALATSLGDEILAAGKPLLFYDYERQLAPYFEYPRLDCLVHDYEALRARFELFAASGVFSDIADTASAREFYFNVQSAESVRSRIGRTLEMVLKEHQ